MTLTRTEVRSILQRYGLRPKRSLGQNFVVEPNTVRRIVELAGVGPGDLVVEVGSGLGSLTFALLEAGAVVTAVEIDQDLVRAFEESVGNRYELKLRIVAEDALTVDWNQLLGDRDGQWKLVANLPYNISVPLICDLLERAGDVSRMLVMVQREVAHRLVAGVSDRAYGLPSLRVAYHAEARILAQVPASVFLPRPRVESALVEIVRRSSPTVAIDPRLLFQVARVGFNQRRKMLRRSLHGLIDEEGFTAAGVDPSLRAEDLGIREWAAVAAHSSLAAEDHR